MKCCKVRFVFDFQVLWNFIHDLQSSNSSQGSRGTGWGESFDCLIFPAIKIEIFLLKVLESEGSDLITLDMKPKLPYFEAIISEVQRLASVLPIAPPRVSPVDVVVGGYTIKKNIPVQVSNSFLKKLQNFWGL